MPEFKMAIILDPNINLLACERWELDLNKGSNSESE